MSKRGKTGRKKRRREGKSKENRGRERETVRETEQREDKSLFNCQ